MFQKLLAVVEGKAAIDNSDSPMNQEVLLPGHLYLMVFKVSSPFLISSNSTKGKTSGVVG